MLDDIVAEDVDLNAYPKIVDYGMPNDRSIDEVTIGDLHGNSLFLLHFLIKYGVVELDTTDYLAARDIYNKPADTLSKADFEAFDALISKATVFNTKKVRLLGDILADRGKNDYFNLKMIELLDKAGTDLSILLSNHDAEFILNEEISGLGAPYKEKMMGREFSRSIQTFIASIQKGLLDKNECERLYKKHYLPHIKAIDYCFEPGVKPTLFTHAGMDLRLIEETAKELGVPFEKLPDEKLKASIDALNKKVSKMLREGTFHQYFYEMLTVEPDTHMRVKAFFKWGEEVAVIVTPALLYQTIAGLKTTYQDTFSSKFPGFLENLQLVLPLIESAKTFFAFSDGGQNVTLETLLNSIKGLSPQDLARFNQQFPNFENNLGFDLATYTEAIHFFKWPTKPIDPTNEMINTAIQGLVSPYKERFASEFPLIASRQHLGIDLSSSKARASTRLLWNRDYSDLNPEVTPGIDFIHGHDSKERPGNIQTLDAELGKGDNHTKGKMKVRATSYPVRKKWYDTVEYIITLDPLHGRTLRITGVQLRGRFKRTLLSKSNKLTLKLPEEGLSNREVISRLEAIFTFKDFDHLGKQTFDEFTAEILSVISWPRPEGISLEEINARLKDVYRTNNTPSAKEIERVFCFSEATDVEYEVHEVFKDKLPKQSYLNVSVIKGGSSIANEKKIDKMEIPLKKEMTQDEAGKKLEPAFQGKTLQTTQAEVLMQFSTVFNVEKDKGTRLSGQVFPHSDIEGEEHLTKKPDSV